MGGGSTSTSSLDPQLPAHLDHVRLFITRICLFYQMTTTSEDMFEQAPVRLATEEVLAHRNKCNEIRDCVGWKVMDLRPKEIQKAPEERMWGQRETSVDMGGEEDELSLARLGLGFIPRQPPGAVRNQAIIGKILQVLLHDGGSDPVPWIRPGGSPDRNDVPLAIFLPFVAAVAFFARSTAASLSFTMVA